MSQTRIDDVLMHADGRIELRYTAGDAPLPVEASGDGVVFASKADLVRAVRDVEARLSGLDLVLIHAAIGVRADLALGGAFRTRVRGKTATVDLAGAVAPITLG